MDAWPTRILPPRLRAAPAVARSLPSAAPTTVMTAATVPSWIAKRRRSRTSIEAARGLASNRRDDHASAAPQVRNNATIHTASPIEWAEGSPTLRSIHNAAIPESPPASRPSGTLRSRSRRIAKRIALSAIPATKKPPIAIACSAAFGGRGGCAKVQTADQAHHGVDAEGYDLPGQHSRCPIEDTERNKRPSAEGGA